MKKPNIRKFFKRLKKLNYFGVLCVLYTVFCIHFAISNINDEPLISEKELDTNNSYNVTEISTELPTNSAIISPIRQNFSSSSSYPKYENILLSENEPLTNGLSSALLLPEVNTEDSTQLEEETSTEEETTTIVEEETTVEIETTNGTRFTENSFPRPKLPKDISTDEYIYELIKFYSSYDTRIDLTYDNILWLSRMVYNESRGEVFEGQIAVAEVAINRFVASSCSNIKDILLAPNQFSVGSNTNKSCILAAVYAILGANPTHGAHYFADISKAPDFFALKKGYKITRVIGCHTFFLKGKE